MKIIGLELQNTLRLKAVNIHPNGKSVTLGGRNGQGKTSLLQTIAMTLGGADATPPKPCRRGTDKGYAIIRTDDGLTIRLPVTKDGRGALTITTKDNAKYGSPQEMLKKLTGGGVAFDPLEFCNLPADKQRAALMKLLKLDFVAVDAKRKSLYEERTQVNRTVDQTDFKVKGMEFYPNAPAEPVNTADLVAELDKANQYNKEKDALEEAADTARVKADDAANTTANQRLKIADLEAKLAAARKELEQFEVAEKTARTASEAADKKSDDFKLIDTAPISAKLADSGETNRQVQANVLRQDGLTALEGHRQKSANLTAQIDKIDADKAAALAAAPLPAPGLGFDDTGVTFNGVPLEQSNFNERLRVSMAMSAAMNPTLRVVVIRDAQLLDDENYAYLWTLIDEYKVQAFVERIGKGAECSVIIEDGEVAEVRDPEMQAPTPEPVAENVLSHDAHETAGAGSSKGNPDAFSL